MRLFKQLHTLGKSETINNDNIELNTNEYIENTYIGKIKKQIEESLLNKGYTLEKSFITIETEDETKYGKINSINIVVSKLNNDNNNNFKTNEKNRTNTSININSVEIININIKENTKNDFQNNINNEEIFNQEIIKEEVEEIEKYLSDTYSIPIDKIIINV